jgi:hypothetical protein
MDRRNSVTMPLMVNGERAAEEEAKDLRSLARQLAALRCGRGGGDALPALA